MNLKNLPFWGQMLIAVLFAVGILFIGYKVWPNFTSINGEIESKQEQLADLEREIRQGQAIETKLPEFQREITSLQAKLDDLLLILPTEPEAGNLLRRVKNLAQLSASVAICISAADRLRCFRAYAATEPELLRDWKRWFRAVIRECERKIVVRMDPIE